MRSTRFGLTCHHCERSADFLYFVDRGNPKRYPADHSRAIPACDVDGLPGGYEVPLDDLAGDFAGWFEHLGEKRWRGDLALRDLLGLAEVERRIAAAL